MDMNQLMQFFQQYQQQGGGQGAPGGAPQGYSPPGMRSFLFRGMMPGQGQTITGSNGQEFTQQADGRMFPGGPMRAFNTDQRSDDFRASHPESFPQMRQGPAPGWGQPDPNAVAQLNAAVATRAPVPVPMEASDFTRAPVPSVDQAAQTQQAQSQVATRAPVQGALVGQPNAAGQQMQSNAAFSPMSAFAPAQRLAAPAIAGGIVPRPVMPPQANANIKAAQAMAAYTQAHPTQPTAAPPPPPPPPSAAAPPPLPPPPPPPAGGMFGKAIQMAAAPPPPPPPPPASGGFLSNAAKAIGAAQKPAAPGIANAAAAGQSAMKNFVSGMPGAAAAGARRF